MSLDTADQFAFLRSCVSNPALLAPDYDAIIVGAGPAGAIAALQLSRMRHSVLLLDKRTFPRDKVCGCCLSVGALAALDSVGLGRLPERLGGVPLNQLLVCGERVRTELPLPGGMAVSRRILDAQLCGAATFAGAHFAHGCSALVQGGGDGYIEVDVTAGPDRRRIRASVVVVADGLGGNSLRESRYQPIVDSRSRVGTGAVSTAAPDYYVPGRIYMAHGRGGYLGLVRLEDGKTDLAAALDPGFLRDCGSPAAAARRLLKSASLPIPLDLDEIRWRGTLALSRKRRAIAGPRLFLVGDAAGYVEPFTGEGIAWALTSGMAAVPVVTAALRRWDSALIRRWNDTHGALVGRKQLSTKIVAAILRHQSLVGLMATALNTVPGLAAPLVDWVTGHGDRIHDRKTRTSQELLEWSR